MMMTNRSVVGVEAALSNLPALSPTRRKCKVLCCVSNAEVDKLAPYLLESGDVVVEVGSTLGSTTRLLRDLVGNTGRILAFDKKRKLAKNATSAAYRNTSELQGVDFAELSGSTAALDICLSILSTIFQDKSSLVSTRAAKAIFLDTTTLSGLDMFLDFVQLIQVLESILVPVIGARFLVVKSRVLKHCSRRFFGATFLCQSNDPTPRFNFFRQELDLASRGSSAGWKDPGPVVIGSKRVHEYRNAALLCVKPGDDVLEIGCHCGKTTALLVQETVGARVAVGIDIGPKIIAEAQKRYPHVAFRVADAWDTRKLLELAKEFASPSRREAGTRGEADVGESASSEKAAEKVAAYEGSFDVILVDVGGLSSDSGLMESLGLIRQLSHAFRPRLRAIIIKSACIREFCGKMTPANLFVEIMESRRKQALEKGVQEERDA